MLRSLTLLSALLLALATPPALEAQECVDINVAPSEQLQRIIHIGPERAGQIITLRQSSRFASVDALVRVRGIAAGRLADIKRQGLACVKPGGTVLGEMGEEELNSYLEEGVADVR